MRQGIDTVEIARIEKLISELDDSGLRDFFSEAELADAGSGPGQAQKLAARFAAKEACCKLFPKEICLGRIEPFDFSVAKDGYGQPSIVPSPRGRAAMDLHQIERIDVSLTHTEATATAIASVEPRFLCPAWYGRLAFRFFPLRKTVVMENLNRVFGPTLDPEQIAKLAQGFYAHHLRCLWEFVKLPFLSKEQKRRLIRFEGLENLEHALAQGKGVLLLTGHFGNWEVSTVAGIALYEDFRGRFHFIRRPLKPKWFNDFVIGRFRRAGFGTIEKEDSLDEILDLLEQNHIIVSVFDQFAIENFGISSQFFGHRAHTFKSLAVLAQFTGAPVVPSSSWRERDGTHVLRFDPPVPLDTEGRTRDNIARNTKLFNEALERIILRHPEQWIWMHRRWKKVSG